MAKRRGPKLAQHRREARWLAWEIIRLSAEYHNDVQALVNKWKSKLDRQLGAEASLLQYRKRMATRDALDAYVSLTAETARLKIIGDHIATTEPIGGILSGDCHDPPEHRYKEREQWWRDQSWRFCQLYNFGVKCGWGKPPIRKWRKQPDIDLLPELRIFESRWGLRFPLPPELDIREELEWDVLAVPMAKAVKTVKLEPHAVTLQVWPGVTGRDLIRELIELELSHADPQKPGKRKPRVTGKKPDVHHQPDGSLLVTVALPYDANKIRLYLARLPRAVHRLRNFRSAVQVARLVHQGKSLQEIADLVIKENIGGGTESAAAARQRAAHRLFQTFSNLQDSLLRMITTQNSPNYS